MAVDDHDLLLGLRAELGALRATVEAHGIASVERDTRIETKVDKINGTVALHDDALLAHALVPHSGVDHVLSTRLISRIDEMWTAWSIGKWVGAAGVIALLGQTVALVLLVVRQGG